MTPRQFPRIKAAALRSAAVACAAAALWISVQTVADEAASDEARRWATSVLTAAAGVVIGAAVRK